MATSDPLPGSSTMIEDDESEYTAAASDGKILSPEQEVFVKSHTESWPSKLTFEKSLKTKNLHGSCWRTVNDDTIVLGSYMQKPPRLTVLTADGAEKGYGLLKGTVGVHGGLALTDEKHIICVDTKHVYTVNIPHKTLIDTILHPVNELDISEPRHIFARSKLEYGVLCLNPFRVELFSLKQILLERNATNNGVIKLDIPNPSAVDTACFRTDGVICVASYHDNLVYIYNDVGERLDIIGMGRHKGDKVQAGLLYTPMAIQCCSDAIIVSCRQGDVHCFANRTWSLLMTKGNTDIGKFSSLLRKKKIYSVVLSENRLWGIQCPTDKDYAKDKLDDFRIVNLYTF